MKNIEAASGLRIPKNASALALGMAWGGSSVNVVPFRQDALVTSNGIQYFSYFGPAGEVIVGTRNLTDGEVKSFKVTEPSECKPWDSHNCISLGLDEEGYIHVAYDHHASALKYRKSQKPNDVSLWSPEVPMTGVGEARVTYPTFISPTSDKQSLLFLMREGVWYSGAIRLKRYSVADSVWTDVGAHIVSGADNSLWTANPYFNRVVRDDFGVIHLCYVWRSKAPIGDDLVNNVNLCYLKSADEGKTWSGTSGLVYPIPVTPVNSDVILAVPPGQNLMNQCGMDVDAQGNPHVVYYANDVEGVPQYYHVWLKDGAWHRTLVTQRTTPFSLKGKGTLSPPISRPQVVISKTGRVFVLGRLDYGEPGLSCFWADAPNYEFNSAQYELIISGEMGAYEPVFDYSRVRTDSLLSLYIQYARETGNDLAVETFSGSAYIIDMPLTLVGELNE